MEFVLQGFGVFLGVLAGTAVTLLVQWIVRKQGEAQKKRNLKFEFELNIRKIDQWLDEVTAYRNAINGDAIDTYFGFFDFSRAVLVTLNDMFVTGQLYKFLDHDQIGKLQLLFSDFSPFSENYFNNQITQNKRNFSKSKAVQEVNFLETKLKEHRKTLSEIVKKLS